MGNPCSKVTRVENGPGVLQHPPDSSRSGLNKEWLVRELHRGGYKVHLRELKVEQLSAANIDGEMRQDGGGISGSRILRLRLVYDEGSPKLPGDADTLVMKWTNFKKVPPLSFNMRVAQVVLFKVNQADLFRTEHYFRANVKEVHSWGLKTPITYCTALQDASEPGGCCRLAFDSRSKLITSCIMQDIGNYKTPAAPFDEVSRDMARGALVNIAKLHRATWGKQGKYTADLHKIYGRNGFATSHIGLYGLKGSGVFKRKADFKKSDGPSGLHNIWGVGNKDPGNDKGLNAIKKATEKVELLNAFRDVQANWDLVLPKLGNIEPQCMVHGDFHHWNNMYGVDSNDVMVIDWQYFGAGRVVYELIYFFNCGITPTNLDDDEELLKAYYDALVSPDLPGAPPPLTFDDLVSDFRCAIIDAAVTMCISMGTRTMGVSYTPKDYKGMASDPKQRDFVVGGMLLAERLFGRFTCIHKKFGTFSKAIENSATVANTRRGVKGYTPIGCS
eukprot:TRINITY_DN10955_c0_g1_i3.p1 TRINITY_DN10955_c0_g1~~TRINITY_DN10955_c0_g1_i3.p1  ORF type:complete len:514 (+),score=121.66 TRINITY_DN10955_c0_g1_i3:39-1544(+)